MELVLQAEACTPDEGDLFQGLVALGSQYQGWDHNLCVLVIQFRLEGISN